MHPKSPIDCLLNSLFMLRTKKTSKHRIIALCEGKPSVSGGFLLNEGSNAEIISMSSHLQSIVYVYPSRNICYSRHKPTTFVLYKLAFCKSSSILSSIHWIILITWMQRRQQNVLKLIEAEWRIYASVNKPSLVQIMACRLDGAKPLSEPMLEYC